MADRRMFNKSIVCSDEFLEMPDSTQNLYFHLSMNADDDGFVDKPKSIIRMIGAKEDDLKVLITKAFVLPFDTGIIVIRHWRLNNYIQKDRKKDTIYQEELSQLQTDNNGAYILSNSNISNVSLEKKEHKPLTLAQQKRYEEKKNSDLPYSFDYKIKAAFLGKPCPICGCIMNTFSKKTQPTIQHNKPISKGGKHELDNISVICGECNYSIQDNETGKLNNEEVKKIWAEILNENVSGMDTQISIDQDSIDKYSIDNNIYAHNNTVESEPALYKLQLNDNSYFEVTQSFYDELKPLYPAVNLDNEFRKMISWIIGNPTKRKTRRGIKKFITSWLSKVQDKCNTNTVQAPNNFIQHNYSSEELNGLFDNLDEVKLV